MAESWMSLVQRVWKENKSKAGYKFKDAMSDAKKMYKKPAQGEAAAEAAPKKSRKSRKSTKKSKKSKSRKTRKQKR